MKVNKKFSKISSVVQEKETLNSIDSIGGEDSIFTNIEEEKAQLP